MVYPPLPAICLHDMHKNTPFILEVLLRRLIALTVFLNVKPHVPCNSVSEPFLFDEFLHLSEKFNVFLRT
jgi:hypothetical protein